MFYLATLWKGAPRQAWPLAQLETLDFSGAGSSLASQPPGFWSFIFMPPTLSPPVLLASGPFLPSASSGTSSSVFLYLPLADTSQSISCSFRCMTPVSLNWAPTSLSRKALSFVFSTHTGFSKFLLHEQLQKWKQLPQGATSVFLERQAD